MTDTYSNFIYMKTVGLHDDTEVSIEVDDATGIVAPVNATWYNEISYPAGADDPNIEVIRITNVSGNVLTVTRAQESSTASTKNTTGGTYRIIVTPTAKSFSDIDDIIDPMVTKLATVEENAKDDQTGDEIVTLINGQASIIDDANIASTIARDSEVSGAITSHANEADPHTQYQLESEKGALSGYAELDGGGKVPQAQLPLIALTMVFTAVSEAAQLLLVVEEGDVCIRTDESRTYIALNSDNANMADWQEMLTPADTVSSVFGRTGVVSAQANDYLHSQLSTIGANDHHNESHDIDSHTGNTLTIDTINEKTSTNDVRIQNLKIGDSLLGTNFAELSHHSRFGTYGYSMLSCSDGRTLINASTGSLTSFRINNISVCDIDASGLHTNAIVERSTNYGVNVETVNFKDGDMNIPGNIEGDVISQESSFTLASNLLGLMTDPRLLVLMTDSPTGTINDYSGKGHTGSTVGGMTTGDQLYKGLGYVYDFDGASDAIKFVDHDDFTFGDGSNDSDMTMGFLIYVDPGTVNQTVMSKVNNYPGYVRSEWMAVLKADETFSLYLCDNSAASVFINRVTSVLSAGYHWIVATYEGAGLGSAAASRINIYVDGVLDNGAVVNDATYVAMENTATDVVIGYRQHGGSIIHQFKGNAGVVFLDGVEWSAADVYRSYLLIKGTYNL